jgi:tRNA pseudouridine38-40 synthase
MVSRVRRVKFTIAYDGSSYSGWQSQPGGNAIQDHVERALGMVMGEKGRLHGAGRTDAGVHALGQCAHADLMTRLQPEALRPALNASLPASIRIMRCRFVPETFHARFSARGKVYRYRIATGPVLSPFEAGRAWHVIAPLNELTLRRAARLFVGTHDFASFAANRGKPVATTVRSLHKVDVRIQGRIITITVEGDGFLYKMVRFIVGALVQCATGKIKLDDLRERLDGKAAHAHRLLAPPDGLTLVRVRY